jgi:hypothetical protein
MEPWSTISTTDPSLNLTVPVMSRSSSEKAALSPVMWFEAPVSRYQTPESWSLLMASELPRCTVARSSLRKTWPPTCTGATRREITSGVSVAETTRTMSREGSLSSPASSSSSAALAAMSGWRLRHSRAQCPSLPQYLHLFLSMGLVSPFPRLGGFEPRRGGAKPALMPLPLEVPLRLPSFAREDAERDPPPSLREGGAKGISDCSVRVEEGELVNSKNLIYGSN